MSVSSDQIVKLITDTITITRHPQNQTVFMWRAKNLHDLHSRNDCKYSSREGKLNHFRATSSKTLQCRMIIEAKYDAKNKDVSIRCFFWPRSDSFEYLIISSFQTYLIKRNKIFLTLFCHLIAFLWSSLKN